MIQFSGKSSIYRLGIWSEDAFRVGLKFTAMLVVFPAVAYVCKFGCILLQMPAGGRFIWYFSPLPLPGKPKE